MADLVGRLRARLRVQQRIIDEAHTRLEDIRGARGLALVSLDVEQFIDDLQDELLMALGPTCEVCGCTEQLGCEEGCFWVREGLCSVCAKVNDTISVLEGQGGGDGG